MANAWNHSFTSSVSKVPTLWRVNAALNTRNGRPEMSIATRVSASSIGTCTSAERDAAILGGVMVIDMQVALGVHRDVDAGMARQQLQHVVEKAHAGADRRL